MQPVPQGTVVYVPTIKTLVPAEVRTVKSSAPAWVTVLWGRTQMTQDWVICIRPLTQVWVRLIVPQIKTLVPAEEFRVRAVRGPPMNG